MENVVPLLVTRFSKQQYVFLLVGNMLPLMEKTVFPGKNMCSSISGKYVSDTKQIVFTGKNMFLLVRYMFLLLGENILTGKNMCFH